MLIHKKIFTKNRRPYKSYINAPWTWNEVFNDLNQLKNNNVSDFFIKISVKYGILYKTLTNKYRDFNNNKIIIDNKEHRGGSNKFFTRDDEQKLFNYFKNNFIDKNELLCDEIIKIKAILESKLLYPTKKFVASSGWCCSFKNRWNLFLTNYIK